MATTLPYKYDLSVYRGDTFRRTITLKQNGVAVNLTGSTIRAQARRSAAGNAAIVLEFTIENFSPTLGKFDLVIPATTTKTLNLQLIPYDLEVVGADGTTTTWLAGNLTITADISRAA